MLQYMEQLDLKNPQPLQQIVKLPNRYLPHERVLLGLIQPVSNKKGCIYLGA